MKSKCVICNQWFETTKDPIKILCKVCLNDKRAIRTTRE